MSDRHLYKIYVSLAKLWKQPTAKKHDIPEHERCLDVEETVGRGLYATACPQNWATVVNVVMTGAAKGRVTKRRCLGACMAL